MSEWVVKMVKSCVEYFELKSLLDGRKDGWMDGWMNGKAGLRIAYSNQKLFQKWYLATLSNIALI